LAGDLTSGWFGLATELTAPVEALGREAKGSGFAADAGATAADSVGVEAPVGAEMVSEDSVPADRFFSGAAGPTVKELDEVDAGGGVEAVGVRSETATGCGAGVAWAWRRKFQVANAAVTTSKAIASLPHGTGAED